MANAGFNNIYVSGIACAVPKKVEKTTDYIDALGANEIRRFITVTGIRERHWGDIKQTTSDLCFVATERLLNEKQIEKDSIDAVIFVTQTPDYLQPATAHVLHKRLGLSKDCMAFDVNLGCSGYVYGMYLASTILQSGNIRRVLLLAGEAASNQHFKEKDKMLFGDAGTASIIERGNTEVKCLLKADGNGYNSLIIPGGSTRNPVDDVKSYNEATVEHMNGTVVFEFGINEVPKAFKEFFEINGGCINDYDYCIFQQANLFLIKHKAKRIELPLSKMPVSMDRYGNASSASIPLTIVDLCERESVRDRLKLITCGFGIGFSWGVASFTVESKNVLPMIYTDDYYEEAYHG